ncbi:hypothetical protein PInf_022901 [Phytophthora infestans]|nr:hypothetical protein PInf_022901 [Phytophthora infestans]
MATPFADAPSASLVVRREKRRRRKSTGASDPERRPRRGFTFSDKKCEVNNEGPAEATPVGKRKPGTAAKDNTFVFRLRKDDEKDIGKLHAVDAAAVSAALRSKQEKVARAEMRRLREEATREALNEEEMKHKKLSTDQVSLYYMVQRQVKRELRKVRKEFLTSAARRDIMQLSETSVQAMKQELISFMDEHPPGNVAIKVPNPENARMRATIETYGSLEATLSVDIAVERRHNADLHLVTSHCSQLGQEEQQKPSPRIQRRRGVLHELPQEVKSLGQRAPEDRLMTLLSEEVQQTEGRYKAQSVPVQGQNWGLQVRPNDPTPAKTCGAGNEGLSPDVSAVRFAAATELSVSFDDEADIGPDPHDYDAYEDKTPAPEPGAATPETVTLSSGLSGTTRSLSRSLADELDDAAGPEPVYEDYDDETEGYKPSVASAKHSALLKAPRPPINGGTPAAKRVFDRVQALVHNDEWMQLFKPRKTD